MSANRPAVYRYVVPAPMTLTPDDAARYMQRTMLSLSGADAVRSAGADVVYLPHSVSYDVQVWFDSAAWTGRRLRERRRRAF